MRYYFHLKKGSEFLFDPLGLYLPSLDAARAEAVHAWDELIETAGETVEVPTDSEIRIADQEGNIVLTIPLCIAHECRTDKTENRECIARLAPNWHPKDSLSLTLVSQWRK